MINQEASELRVGSLVRLNSGSPDLTVISVDDDFKTVAIEWLDGEGISRAVFPTVCLKKA